ncbi:MAG: hypothetical protein QM781_04870 [Chitinophagaceae bacterium]
MKKAAPLIFFGIIIMFFVIRNVIRNNNISKNRRYSAGSFYRVTVSVDGGPLGEFEFKFNGKSTTGGTTLQSSRAIELGKYYLVEFDSENPKNCRIDIRKEISPEILKKMPDSGWTIRPRFTERKRIAD